MRRSLKVPQFRNRASLSNAGGGSINVETEYGVFTEFIITLPRGDTFLSDLRSASASPWCKALAG
jgi:hypothetical protein